MKSKDDEAPHYTLFLTSCFFLSVRSEYSPQHPVLKRPQSMFLLQGE